VLNIRPLKLEGRALNTAKTGLGFPTVPSRPTYAASSSLDTTFTDGSGQNAGGCSVRLRATIGEAVSYCTPPVE
jgi:hypothetical protein